jgi:murein DD-endopeptidase MepM/ murein hydrolase activator NlpD
MLTPTRSFTALGLLIALGACDNGLDLDMRGRMGGAVDTSQAALQASANRPEPDARGVISYPNYQVAVARRGDTLESLAARIGLPAAELARYNGVQTGDRLRAGEVIALPRRVAEPGPATGAMQPPARVDVTTLAGNAIDRAPGSAQPAATPAPGVEPVRHKVARGETAFTSARLYQVTPRALAEWNGLDAEFSLREGQYLLIPTVQDAPRAAQSASVTVPGAGTATPQPPSASKPLPSEVLPPANQSAALAPAASAPAAATKPAAKPAAQPAPKPAEPVAEIGQKTAAASSGGVMIMPVSGSIIREYAKGRNEGIDIAAAPGTPVKAAASGKVAAISSTDDGVKFMLIRHPDDLISVYTYVDDIAVAKGDAVSRGQTVARVRAGSPSFLHFEVRKGFESTDPMPYLR